MGFGLLFIGYFIAFLMSVNSFGWAFQIVGFYIIFLALQKLAEYKHSIKKCLVPLVVMTLCQVYMGVVSLGMMMDGTGVFAVMKLIYGMWVSTLDNAIFLAASLIFHLFLLHAIKELATDVGDSGIAKWASRNRLFVSFYVLLDVVSILFPSTSPIKFSLYRIVMLISILYPILMLYMLYRCYAGICAPEDADMTPRPSRFAFINKSRAMSEKNEQEMQALINQMQQKKQDKQNQKQKKK